MTYVADVLAGRAKVDDIGAYLEAWHRSDDDVPLSNYLGLTEQEYGRWVEDPAALDAILERYDRITRFARVIDGVFDGTAVWDGNAFAWYSDAVLLNLIPQFDGSVLFRAKAIYPGGTAEVGSVSFDDEVDEAAARTLIEAARKRVS